MCFLVNMPQPILLRTSLVPPVAPSITDLPPCNAQPMHIWVFSVYSRPMIEDHIGQVLTITREDDVPLKVHIFALPVDSFQTFALKAII